jgi:hypothetical protein
VGDTCEAARHAVDQGLICRSALSLIEEASRADEAPEKVPDESQCSPEESRGSCAPLRD